MSSVTVRDPFHDVRSLMRYAFNDPRPRWFGPELWAQGNGERGHAIPVNVYKTDDGVGLDAWVPGFDRDEIEVTLEKGMLTLRATQEGEHEEKAPHYFVHEVPRRVSTRSLQLGDSYDADSVEGTLKNGVLHLEIGRVAEAQPRKVEIAAG